LLGGDRGLRPPVRPQTSKQEPANACTGIDSRMGEIIAESTRHLGGKPGFVDSDGLRISFETFGTGAPIVLVHGWGSSLQANWVATGWVDALLPIRQVVALDVRGHGFSDKPHDQSVYSYKEMSRDVLSVMDHLEIPRADLMGYSMGSCIATALLGSDRTRFTSMILGGIGDENEQSLAMLPRIVAGLRAEDPAEIRDPVSLGYRSYALSDPRNDLEALALSALQIWPEGFPLQLIGPDVTDIELPVLVVNGADDDPYVKTVDRLVDAIPGAELVVIPDRDHVSVIEDPRFKQKVQSFLATTC
jgi:pimeloyl-ACP methyl ester carboxylesterase